MSRSDIADHLGLTIHTVSRTLSEFVRRRLISLDGPQSIMIDNYSALKKLADGDEDHGFADQGDTSHTPMSTAPNFTPQFGS